MHEISISPFDGENFWLSTNVNVSITFGERLMSINVFTKEEILLSVDIGGKTWLGTWISSMHEPSMFSNEVSVIEMFLLQTTGLQLLSLHLKLDLAGLNLLGFEQELSVTLLPLQISLQYSISSFVSLFTITETFVFLHSNFFWKSRF